MHSCETLPATPPVASGPNLLLQLGRLIIRSRSTSPAARASPQPATQRDRLLHAKLLNAAPSTSQQVPSQQKPETVEPRPSGGLEAQLSNHVHALWNEHIPICIEVLLAPDCPECYSSLNRVEEEATYDKQHTQQRALLLERWTMRALVNKSHESPAFITSQWLLNAVRSQLHFSQLAAWIARLKKKPEENPTERRRKLSREKCNYKKLESNCDDNDPANDDRNLNIVYSIKLPGESYKMAEFNKPPTDHTFPITDIGSNVYLKVCLESLPRIDDIPTIKCTCQKRRASKETPVNIHDELVGKLNDLTLTPKFSAGSINSNVGNSSRRLSIISNPGSTEYMYSTADKDPKADGKVAIVDDRMHTPCSESGKHKCNCDEESDLNQRSSTSLKQEPKKLDEKRLKEIAKYKRRLRKESKLKKLCDSTSSEGDGLKKETHTSIPILQAARFDRFRAIGCYRNQTYLTLPASRMESKSPFIESVTVPPTEFKKTVSISTQTEDLLCQCGVKVNLKCEDCRGMVRSEANYNLASLNKTETSEAAERSPEENGVRRKCEEDGKSFKKLKCDNFSNLMCDNSSLVDGSFSSSSSFESNESGSRGLEAKDACNEHKDQDICECETRANSEEVKKSNARNNETRKGETINTDARKDGGSIERKEESDARFEDLIKRPKLRRFFPIVDRIEKIVSDRLQKDSTEKDMQELHLKTDDTVFSVPKETKRQKTFSISEEEYVCFEKCDYGTIDKCDMDSPKEETGFRFPDPRILDARSLDPGNVDARSPEPKDLDPKKFGQDSQVPSPSEMDRFRWRFDSAASMVFHTKTGLPLTSSPAPLRRGNNCFDFDDSINGISGIKSALFHPISPPSPSATPASPASPAPKEPRVKKAHTPPPAKKENITPKLRIGPTTGLLGSFEESALKGRLEPVATVHGFTAELGASGAFCPPHKRLPVTVFFYAPGGTNAPYMGHINLGPSGYRVPRSGTIQVSLFNPHGTLVKMFVVLYDLQSMPPLARTFLRQRTLYMPAGAEPPRSHNLHKWLRYLIHLRFMTSKSGKLYLHTDIRILVSRKADLDTATAHSALFRPATQTTQTTQKQEHPTQSPSTSRSPNRVFGGCSEFDSEIMREIGYENQNGVSYELRSFTYAPDNPKYSPR